MGHGIALAASAARPICSSDFGRANGTPSGIGRGWGLASSNGSSAAVPVPERPCSPAASKAKLSALAAIATRSPMHNRPCFAVVILNRPSINPRRERHGAKG